ncbi:MAG: hypothetical protein NT069_22045, partial [Planctomycetota bacterium]|nr:hypothetical protein [Planctomycetota bacterium]
MTQQDATHRPVADRRPNSLKWRGIIGCCVFGAVAWFGFRNGGSAPRGVSDGTSNQSAAVSQLASVSAAGNSATDANSTDSVEIPLDQRVLGEWRDHYRGERTLVLNADGTGTMVVVLAGFAKKLFAERLTFDIQWSLEEGEITLKTVSGQPEAKFNMIRKVYGDEATYRVLAVNADQMRLLDGDGKQ